MDRGSLRAARLFRESGLQIGDGVALFLENHSRFFELCWAAQRSGLYYTPISTQLSAAEVDYIVGDCGAKLFVTSAALAGEAAQLASLMPGVGRRLMLDGVVPGYEALEPLAEEHTASVLSDQTAGQSMLYSSGTTGRPKGVRRPLSEEAMTAPHPLLEAVPKLYSIDENTTYLSPAPLYHAAPIGFNMSVQMHGGTCVIMKKFDAEALLQFIQEHQITHANMVPTMFVRLRKLPEAVRRQYDLSSLKVVIHGAAPCPVEVKEQMIDWWGPVLEEYYSASEGNLFCFIDSHDWLAHKGSVGKSVMGPLHILDEAGNELPPGEPGEIWSSYATDFAYHNDPEKTARVRNERGWTTLGDIGYLDDEGYLYLTDRKAFTIISGGVNVYPQEAEGVLILHPKVVDVAVIGVPDEEMGEAVKAVVQPVSMAGASAELESELIAFCRDRLVHFKCPRSVDFIEALPRHETGKLYKRLLKDHYWGERATRIV